MDYMKIAKPTIYLIILLSVSYSSIWYGFSKGVEYSYSHKLGDAAFKTSDLRELRKGDIEKVTNSLELGIDLNLIEYRYSDKEFVNYIVGFPRVDNNTHESLLGVVRKYRETSSYKCVNDVEVCNEINDTLYGSKASHNK